MANKKFMSIVGGKNELIAGVSSSAGAGNAGDLIALDSTGKLDVSMLPVGVGPDVKVHPASEALAAGNYVNIWNDAGTIKVRLADNSNGREAHGFVLTSALEGADAVVYFEGPNTAAPIGTVNNRVYLGVAGGVVTTALDIYAPANEGKLHQFLGIYIDTDEVNTDIDDYVII